MKVTDEEFEKALEICNIYISQLAKKLSDTRARMKEIHISNSDDSRFLTAGIAVMDRDTPIEALKHADGRLYNILRYAFEKGATIAELETVTEDEFKEFRQVGVGVLKRVKGLMNIAGLKFKSHDATGTES